jgi:translation elongation factor EF-1beta
MEDNEIKEKQEKLDKAANDMKDIGCGIIALIFLVIIIIYCIILLGALF